MLFQMLKGTGVCEESLLIYAYGTKQLQTRKMSAALCIFKALLCLIIHNDEEFAAGSG